jgi:hypothetical protein
MAAIKTIGSSGQIALGKQYAGRQVLIDELEPGVWVLKLGEFIPDNERWLHDPAIQEDLEEGLTWLSQTPPQATDLAEFEKRILGGEEIRKGSTRSE